MRTFTKHSTLLCAVISLCTIPAHAQVLFAVPDTTPNYAGYRYLDECAIAIRRLTSQVERQDKIWDDTMRMDWAPLFRPYPTPAVEAGRLCAQQVDIDTVQIANTYSVASLLLTIGRDEETQRLYDRMYAAATSEVKPRLAYGMLDVYRTARPMRLAAMKALYERVRSEPWGNAPGTIIEFGTMVAEAAFMGGDTAYTRKIGAEVIALNEKLSVEDRNYQRRTLGIQRNLLRTFAVRRLYRILTEQDLLDSLSAGPQAYRQYRKTMLNNVFGMDIALDATPVGRKFPNITVDYLFRAVDSTSTNSAERSLSYVKASLPSEGGILAPGRVNIVVFLQGGCHVDTENGSMELARFNGFNTNRCVFIPSVLRRLKHAHPEVNILVVTRTFGSLGMSAPLIPDQEADTLAKFFLAHHRIPGSLVVETTKFFRIPGIDQRRIDEPSRNEESLKPMLAKPFTVLAVDENGEVFRWDEVLQKGDELELDREVAAVLKRPRRQAP